MFCPRCIGSIECRIHLFSASVCFLLFLHVLTLVYIFFHTLLVSNFWTSRGILPSPSRLLPSIFISHRVQKSHCSWTFLPVVQTHAFAIFASQFVDKRKFQRIYTSMHSAGLELTKLTYYQAPAQPDTPPKRPVTSIEYRVQPFSSPVVADSYRCYTLYNNKPLFLSFLPAVPVMGGGPGRPAKTCGPSYGPRGRRHPNSSSRTSHSLVHGPGQPVKTRGPPHGRGRAAQREAHISWATHRPGPIKLGVDGPQPDPVHRVYI